MIGFLLIILAFLWFTFLFILAAFELEIIDYSKVNSENLEYIYEMLKNQELFINTQKNIYKNEIIQKILETTQNEEYLIKFADIIISENEDMVNNISNQEKNRLSEKEIARYLHQQEEIYSLAMSIKEEQYEWKYKKVGGENV